LRLRHAIRSHRCGTLGYRLGSMQRVGAPHMPASARRVFRQTSSARQLPERPSCEEATARAQAPVSGSRSRSITTGP
jgi:hypothetical protein